MKKNTANTTFASTKKLKSCDGRYYSVSIQVSTDDGKNWLDAKGNFISGPYYDEIDWWIDGVVEWLQ